MDNSMNNSKNHVLTSLAQYEFEILPAMLLGNEIPFLLVLQEFSKISTIYLKDNYNVKISETHFVSTTLSFQFSNSDSLYYVVVFEFPFTKNDFHVDLVKRYFIVFSEKLNDAYVFVEVLRKEKNNFFYEVYYIEKLKNNQFKYNYLKNHNEVETEDFAKDCCVFAVGLENNK